MAKDMTRGNPAKLIILFSIPLLIGNIFQQFYSMVDTIIVGRKDSPLVIGTKSDENYIASDIPALLTYTKDFYLLDDNELAVITKDSISFYNNDLKTYEKEIKNI